MNRQEFLQRLQDRLQGVDAQDQAEVLRYFDELIQDKAADAERPEEDIIQELGLLDEIAATVLEGAAQKERKAPPAEADTPASGVIRTLTAKADQVRDVQIAAFDIRVRIEAGTSDEVLVSYPQDEDYRFDVSLESGTLRLIRQEELRFRLFRFDLWLMGVGTAMEITLKLPREYAGMLDVKTSNGAITMGGIHVWGGLKLASSNGRIEISHCQAREMTITTGNARIAAERLEARNDLTLRTSNARIHAQGIQAGGVLTLRTSNARIQLESVDAPSMQLKTSNGPIEGVLPGAAEAYSVISSTSNGKNSLAGHSAQGAKQLSAHTSNASIRLAFEKR